MLLKPQGWVTSQDMRVHGYTSDQSHLKSEDEVGKASVCKNRRKGKCKGKCKCR